jgi:hypothetical protein
MKKRTTSWRNERADASIPPMGEEEFGSLGAGKFAYIKRMPAKQARKLYPKEKKDLPKSGDVFLLHAADGTPMKWSASLWIACGQARQDNLRASLLI